MLLLNIKACPHIRKFSTRQGLLASRGQDTTGQANSTDSSDAGSFEQKDRPEEYYAKGMTLLEKKGVTKKDIDDLTNKYYAKVTKDHEKFKGEVHGDRVGTLNQMDQVCQAGDISQEERVIYRVAESHKTLEEVYKSGQKAESDRREIGERAQEILEIHRLDQDPEAKGSADAKSSKDNGGSGDGDMGMSDLF